MVDKHFYEEWSLKKLSGDCCRRREAMLWKAEVMLNVMPEDLKAESILEIGCAEGTILNEISKKKGIKRAVGVDLSKSFTMQGEKSYPDIEFINKDFMDAGFKEKEFELAILSDVIEHVEDYRSFLKKTATVSKNVVFKIPLERCLYSRLFKPPGPKHPSGHLHSFSVRECRSILEEQGLTIVKYSVEIAPLNLMLGSGKNPVIDRCIGGVDKIIRLIPKRILFMLVGGHFFAFCRCPH